MKILVIGSGGREHALVWKISQSDKVKDIFCAPGNPGIAKFADCIDIDPSSIVELADVAQQLRIDLTVVGPELPLSLGIADEFIKRGLRIFGAKQNAALIESSKVYAKELMKKYNIPTGDFAVFEEYEEASEYVKSGKMKFPLVVKADGLAAGKGVIICGDENDALSAVESILVNKKFGLAGKKVLIEEFLEGKEASFIVFTDGKKVVPMVASQDHKQAFDGGLGPNTGGMGAFSPAIILNEELYKSIMKDIIYPTVSALRSEGRVYQGVLYAGIIVTDKGPKVLEYNCRFGDPEAQVILPRLKSDLVDIMNAVIDKELDRITVEWHKYAATCVILASGGYPGSYKKNIGISGLEMIEKEFRDVVVFHSGTKLQDGKIVTNGGRVLGVTAVNPKLSGSIKRAYEAVQKIDFENMHFRTDIGSAALTRGQDEN